MLRSIAFILCWLIAAETITRLADLPVPGAALALAAVTAWFVITRRIDPHYAQIFDAITPHVPLLFVPAAVGVVAHLDALSASWVSFGAAIVGGTAATVLVTGLCATAALKLLARGAGS